jgi:hypothetical protein
VRKGNRFPSTAKNAQRRVKRWPAISERRAFVAGLAESGLIAMFEQRAEDVGVPTT